MSAAAQSFMRGSRRLRISTCPARSSEAELLLFRIRVRSEFPVEVRRFERGSRSFWVRQLQTDGGVAERQRGPRLRFWTEHLEYQRFRNGRKDGFIQVLNCFELQHW
jgi:hypothetical protein